MKTAIKKLDGSRVEISLIIPAKTFAGYKSQALASIGETITIDGFRPGHVPTDVVEKKAGEPNILDEMAHIAIREAYPKIIMDEKIEAIGRPDIRITKIAYGNDLECTITTAVMPSVTLADYKKIAKTVNKEEVSVVVTEEEVASAILEIRQMRAHQKLHDDGVDHHDHNHTNIPDADLPLFDDAFVKTLGAFEHVDDFKKKLQENLGKEKSRHELEKKRITLIDGIIDGSTIDVPDILIDVELDKMMAQFAHDISMMGMTMDDYLKRIEKTEDVLKAEWRENAIKRAKMQLIFEKISADEKIVPSEEEIKLETEKILEMYKDAKDISPERAHAYVTQILTNAKVFEYLEGLK